MIHGILTPPITTPLYSLTTTPNHAPRSNHHFSQRHWVHAARLWFHTGSLAVLHGLRQRGLLHDGLVYRRRETGSLRSAQGVVLPCQGQCWRYYPVSRSEYVVLSVFILLLPCQSECYSVITIRVKVKVKVIHGDIILSMLVLSGYNYSIKVNVTMLLLPREG